MVYRKQRDLNLLRADSLTRLPACILLKSVRLGFKLYQHTFCLVERPLDSLPLVSGSRSESAWGSGYGYTVAKPFQSVRYGVLDKDLT